LIVFDEIRAGLKMYFNTEEVVETEFAQETEFGERGEFINLGREGAL
jgi:hypothetical protein